MVSMKRQLFLATIALTVVIVAVNATSLRVGKREPNDGLVCLGDVNIRAKPDKFVFGKWDCNVPRLNQTITQILALDQGSPGKGGYPVILSGGLNKKNVGLLFISKINQPLNFTIQVYAKPY